MSAKLQTRHWDTPGFSRGRFNLNLQGKVRHWDTPGFSRGRFNFSLEGKGRHWDTPGFSRGRFNFSLEGKGRHWDTPGFSRGRFNFSLEGEVEPAKGDALEPRMEHGSDVSHSSEPRLSNRSNPLNPWHPRSIPLVGVYVV